MTEFRELPLRSPDNQIEAQSRSGVAPAATMLSLNRASTALEKIDVSPENGYPVSPLAAEADTGSWNGFPYAVLSDIYGAALGRRPWTASLSCLQQLLSFKSGLLGVFSDDDRARADLHSIGIQSRFRDALPELLDERDPFFAGRAVTTVLSRIQAGDTGSAPAGESAFVNQWVRAQGLEHGICARARLRVPAGDTLQLVLMVWREIRVRAFSRAQVDLVKSLLPHFRAAIRIQEAMKLPASDWRTTARMLERLPIGVVVLRRDGRPMRINGWAADLIARCDGIFVSKNGLEAISAVENARLREAIERVFGVAGEMNALDRLVVTRTNGEQLHLFVHLLGSQWASEEIDQPLAFAFIAEKEMPTQEHGLLNDYGLTVAEARIALSIAAGLRLDTVAEQLGVSLSTARTHLQRVFSKTGTQRQVELVRLLLASRRSWVE